MEEWEKVGRKKKWKVVRSNDKLVVGVRVIYEIYIKNGEVDKSRYQLAA